MNKLWVTTALAAALASTSAMAKDDFFMGLEYGKAKHYSNNTVSELLSSTERSAKEKANTYGIRVGKYLSDDVRVYANLNEGRWKDNGDKHTSRQLTASADYILNVGTFKPFAGVTLGTNWAKAKVNNDNGSNSDRDYAWAYGAQMGVMTQVGAVDVEAGYRYLKHKNELIVDRGDSVERLNYKKSKTPYISASYRF